MLATNQSSAWPRFWQRRPNDCGPCCLYLILRHHGIAVSFGRLLAAAGWCWRGVTLLGLARAARQVGLSALSAHVSRLEDLSLAPLPCIAHVDDNHFVVVEAVTPDSVTLTDPCDGRQELGRDAFRRSWKGTVLLLLPVLA